MESQEQVESSLEEGAGSVELYILTRKALSECLRHSLFGALFFLLEDIAELCRGPNSADYSIRS